MKTTNKSISNNSIHLIQLKLFDFMDEKPNFDEILNKRLKQQTSFSNNYSLELDENNTFKYVNPECPKCGSHKIIKKGTISCCCVTGCYCDFRCLDCKFCFFTGDFCQFTWTWVYGLDCTVFIPCIWYHVVFNCCCTVYYFGVDYLAVCVFQGFTVDFECYFSFG